MNGLIAAAVEPLWTFVVDVVWKLWIFYTVVVFVNVKLDVRSTSTASNNKRKAEDSVLSIQKSLKDARQLMRSKRLEEANEVLQKAILFVEEEIKSNFITDSETIMLTKHLEQLHTMKSLCLLHQENAICSMVAMDQGLRIALTFDADLMNSANCCFQLFYKWCSENFDQFKQDILLYHAEKKRYLKLTVGEKPQPSLLLESIHSFLLADFLAKNKSLSDSELFASKELCHLIYAQVNPRGSLKPV